jgi:hypothetical protein
VLFLLLHQQPCQKKKHFNSSSFATEFRSVAPLQSLKTFILERTEAVASFNALSLTKSWAINDMTCMSNYMSSKSMSNNHKKGAFLFSVNELNNV